VTTGSAGFAGTSGWLAPSGLSTGAALAIRVDSGVLGVPGEFAVTVVAVAFGALPPPPPPSPLVPRP
jgi:hypothetical protein